MFKFPTDFPSYQEVAKDQSSKFHTTFNEQRYMFVAVLDNGIDEPITIPNEFIRQFNFNDALLGFEQIGVLEYVDPFLTLRRLFHHVANTVVETDCVRNEEGEPISDFSFSGSGNERLHIKMVPLEDAEGNDDVSQKKFQKGDYFLMQSFIITEITNPMDTLKGKTFRLELEGIESYVLKQTRVENFVCGRIGLPEGTPVGSLPTYPPSGIESTNTKNVSAAALTGEAIYEIIKQSYDSYTESTGFDMSGYLPAITYDQTALRYRVDESELKNQKKIWSYNKNRFRISTSDKEPYDIWDFGKSLLYSQMQENETSYTLLKKFFRYHASEQEDSESSNVGGYGNINYDPCILKLRRTTTEKGHPKITLRPYVSYFQNFGNRQKQIYGEEYMDMFFIKNEDTLTERTLGKLKGFLHVANFCGDDEGKIKTTSDAITDFAFVPLSPDDSNRYIVSHHVNYNGSSASYNRNNEDGDFFNTVKYMSEKYIKYFLDETEYKKDGNGNPFPYNLVNIDDTQKLKRANKKPIVTETQVPTTSASITLGRNRLIKNIIFFNDMMSFRIAGSVHRQSGRFYSVDFVEGSHPDDDLLNKLFGIYWSTNITHELDFTNRSYTNEVTGNKFYRHNTKSVILEDFFNLEAGQLDNPINDPSKIIV